MKTQEKIGVLVINLGTPASCEVSDVRSYLKEFLSDPRVLDINPIVRWLLLNLIILRTRPAKSAEAYKTVWTDRGSPLMFHGDDLVEKLRTRMPAHTIRLAMRYGNPSIKDMMQKLILEDGVDRIVIVPLYPQYASSTTGTVLEEVYRTAAGPWNTPSIQVLAPFYNDERYIQALVKVYQDHIDDFDPDHILFSYHGLPIRHVEKSDPTGKHCYKNPKTCCDKICPANQHCYRAQCYATTRQFVARMKLKEGTWSTAFQSRLGKDPWIQPYTDDTLEKLAKDGVKRLAVLCPAFVADCLETLEEIGEEGREEFKHAGGDDLKLIPCLNAEDVWADTLSAMLQEL